MNTEVLERKLARWSVTSDGVRTESADEMIERVASALAEAERREGAGDAAVRGWSRRFSALMTENRFWPSGRILNNAGTRQGQLASCFVLPLEDDFGRIFDTLKLAAACHRTGGGTGFDLTPLREHGAPIATAEAAGASGPVSWLHLFDAETRVVMQGGKMRGANLASLSVRHPDVLAFIDAKQHQPVLPNFNLSVAIDDAFMRAVEAGERVELVSPAGGRVTGTLSAAEVFEHICANAWRTGDPGLLFLDAIDRGNPLSDHLGPITTTNPCGEQTLYPYEASNLGSVNLLAHLSPDGAGIDWHGLDETVTDAVRLLEDAIDVSRYPDPRITRMARANRRLGLGVMGYADVLVRLGVPYDSDRALELIDQVGARFRDAAWAASRALAEERGPFPNWRYTGWERQARNCAVTTIAPTGTISMVAGCSSGIEPRFAALWNKDVISEEGVTHADEELLSEVCLHCSLDRGAALRMLAEVPVQELPIPPEVRARYRYAHDVDGRWHVATAARWQRYIDNAVSKTVNLHRDCTPADVAVALRAAWREGCKGVSVYREGSRERDLLEVRSARPPADERQSRALAQALRRRGGEG